MLKILHCSCCNPDPREGYCQNCGKKARPEATKHEDLRKRFDEAMRSDSFLTRWSRVINGPKQKAKEDAILHGTGFYRIHPDGTAEHIPFEEMRIVLAPAEPPPESMSATPPAAHKE